MTISVEPTSPIAACACTGNPLAVGTRPRVIATISTRNGASRGKA